MCFGKVHYGKTCLEKLVAPFILCLVRLINVGATWPDSLGECLRNKISRWGLTFQFWQGHLSFNTYCKKPVTH